MSIYGNQLLDEGYNSNKDIEDNDDKELGKRKPPTYYNRKANNHPGVVNHDPKYNIPDETDDAK